MKFWLYRTKGICNGVWHPSSPYHYLREDGKTARCGAAVDGEEGYKMVTTDDPILGSRICHNCATGTVVRQ